MQVIIKIDLREIASYLGMILILAAYGLSSFEVFDSSATTYQIMNLTGALLLAQDLVRKKAIAALILEIVWAGIAVVSLVKTLL